MKALFVTGIGTEVGKTVVSAILTRALLADYWKPIQSGDLSDSDSMKVEKWAAHSQLVIHPERYRLTQPLSPHASAKADNIEIKLENFLLPETPRPLVVEGAGGLFVPLNDNDLMIDLMAKLALPVVLVSRHYLGSINHTLLSIEALKARNIPIAGLVFNGSSLPQTEEAIVRFGGVEPLFCLNHHEKLSGEVIAQYAAGLGAKLNHIFRQIS